MPTTSLPTRAATRQLERRRTVALALAACLIACVLAVAIVVATSSGPTPIGAVTSHSEQGFFDHALSSNKDYGLVP
jgi:hypothetical protein